MRSTPPSPRPRAKVTLGAVLAAGLLLASAACGGDDGHRERDVRPEADLTFPGATERHRSFSAAETGRDIHGNDLSHAANLSIRYGLERRTPTDDIYRWYHQQLTRKGWTSLGPPVPDDAGLAVFHYRNGDRLDSFSVNARLPGRSTTTYEVRYQIDIEADG